MRLKMHVFMMSLLLAWLIQLPAYAQKVDCYVLQAPVKQYNNIKKIGVMEFSGNKDAGQMLADQIIARLLQEDRGIKDQQTGFLGLGKAVEGVTHIKGFKTNVYSVIERNQINEILKEQKLGLSGTIDESTAARVGAILGLDAIILGSVNYEKKEDNTSKKYVGFDGKNYTKNCKIRKVTSTASMKIVEVSTAEIIGVETASFESEDKKCDEERAEILNYNQMLNNVLSGTARKFVNYFTPGYTLVRFDMEKIKLKDLKKKADEAGDYLESGNLKQAFPLLVAIYEADSYNPKAAYNAGIIHEMTGLYDDAVNYYQIASQLDPANQLYADALKRAEGGVQTLAFLESIDKPIETYTFSGTGDALAERIVLKGKSSDRVDIYEFPDSKSDAIAKIPGGLEFVVIEQQGDWYRIKLINNKEGFVHKRDVN
ncbi:MAG: SH3 domain-containing protein [Bacteroidetes bacterium]|nr:SH3 domain-containing protein [Bacteroidota bacterium]MBU1578685.1 SH3 domain-containing protein [Bacteroidota bacterium]MBU2558421.1 SH3 domain-containing protein [Bacteroidota bacterium]